MTPEPILLPFDSSGIPHELKSHPHWLVARADGKPVRTRASGNSKTNPDDWTDFETASLICSERPGLWPYIVLTDDASLTFFDIDGKPRKTDESEAEFTERIRKRDTSLARLRELFPVRYEERSKSGNGYHIAVFGSFHGTGGEGGKTGEWSEVEIYTREHGIALTGSVVSGSSSPGHYPPVLLQDLRDEIKGRSSSEIWESTDASTVRPDWARRVLLDLAARIGRPGYHDWRDISSAVFGGVGVESGIEILSEVWPEEKRGEYGELARSLQWFASWGTLRTYGVNPDDPEALLDHMPDLGETASKACDSLYAFRVDHTGTLGMSREDIEALRPPFIIDGFIRRGEVLLLGAESKSRKSWLTQDAGFCVAIGAPWLSAENGDYGFATEQARVHVFDLELSSDEVRYRFAKARAHRFKDSSEAAEATANVISYSLDGLSSQAIQKLIDESKATVRPGDLVIIDCLYRLVPDGNETNEVAAIFEFAKRFAKETKAGVIVVDHFRKAGDDKARNRFAGSFIKQASASTLVAIEVTAGDVMVLSIDARTFHGCNRLHARFNPSTYAFDQLPEVEVEKSKREAKQAEEESWLEPLRKIAADRSVIRAADAAEAWGIKRQSAKPRLDRLVARGWLQVSAPVPGKATEWTFTQDPGMTGGDEAFEV